MSDALSLRVGGGGDPAPVNLPLMLITPALFAGNVLAIRWAEGAAIPPLFLAFGRWALAFLVILPLVAGELRARLGELRPYGLRLLLLAAMGMGVAVGPQYIGARETSAANIALIFAACPVLVTLIDATFWHSTVGRRTRLGLGLAVVGILVVLARGRPEILLGLQFGQGDLWVLVAALGWALYTVLSKRRPLPPLPATVRLAALIGGGALVLAPFALVETLQGTRPDLHDPRLYLLLTFLAVVPSLCAYFCYDRLVGRSGPGRASMTLYMIPLYVTLAAWPLLGEPPHLYHLAGFVLILSGVLLAGRGEGKG